MGFPEVIYMWDKENNMTKDEFASMIDFSMLMWTTRESIIQGVIEAQNNKYRGIVVHSNMINLVKSSLNSQGHLPKIIAVCNYPYGVNDPWQIRGELDDAFFNGAEEIDLVAPLGMIRSPYQREHDLIKWSQGLNLHQWTVHRNKYIKMIIETSLLTEEEIVFATKFAIDQGCKCVKTSTGAYKELAEHEDVDLIRETIQSVGSDTAIKASGGISSVCRALGFIKAGATIIGTSSASKLLEKFEKGYGNE